MNAAPSPTLTVDSRGIGWITFDDPDRKVNVLSEAVMTRLAEVVDEARTAAEEGRARVIVVRSGKPDSFIAGADVDAIEAMEDPVEVESKVRKGQAVFTAVERLPVPTVSAIHGICLGGGLELSLACTHRVLSDSPKTKLGFPEVQIGFLPSWGGTGRFPRLVGLRASLDMLLTGKRIDARKAERIGLAGQVFPAEIFIEKAADFALTTPELPPGSSRKKRPLPTRILDDTAPGRAIVLATARKKVLAGTGGHYPAPLRIIEILRDTLGKHVQATFDAEARAASELLVSGVCKNLLHVFRMREAARKGADVGRDVAPRRVTAMGVLGAGVMGGGIAQLAAYNGIRVRMKDIQHDAVAGGLQHARGLFDKAVERRKLSRRDADQRMELISGGLDYHGFGAVDLVVEAIVEKMDVKRAVLSETEALVREDCILATNTSSLSVDGMAEALRRPELFCGMHFFNPVHRMPLVEVVRGERTSDEAVATVYGLAVAMGKVPVVVGDAPGFLVNRILGPYLNEAGFLLEDGATIQEVDRAAKAFGMPMGPLRLVDEVGIDVSGHVGRIFHEAFGDRLEPPRSLVALASSGRLGRKGGSGFYRYEKGREQGVDESVYADLGNALPPESERGGKDADEIRRRLLVPMVNEAARLLAEGIASTAADVDLAMIMGTGFPPFRGGLIRFADTLHPRGVLDRTRALRDAHGDRFQPAPLLEELARKNRTFYEAFGR